MVEESLLRIPSLTLYLLVVHSLEISRFNVILPISTLHGCTTPILPLSIHLNTLMGEFKKITESNTKTTGITFIVLSLVIPLVVLMTLKILANPNVTPLLSLIQHSATLENIEQELTLN